MKGDSRMRWLMTTNVLIVRIASVLSALLETGGCSESMIYLGFGSDIHEWEVLKSVMLKAGFIQSKAHYVTLTDLGRSKAEEVDRLIAKFAN